MQRITQFKPKQLAKIEVQLWQAYYQRRFVVLLKSLTNLLRRQFGLSVFQSISIANNGVKAVRAFAEIRPTAPHSLYPKKVLPELIIFFEKLKKAINADWEPTVLAKAELAWWIERRRFKYSNIESVGAKIANVYVLLYGRNNQCFQQAGLYRAKAGALRDKQHRLKQKIDWFTIEDLLKKSYQFLLEGLKGCIAS